MSKLTYKDLLDAGVHFGHLTRKWDPRMAPYIFMERNGIHIIDLNKTLATLEEASNAIRAIVRSGRKVLFVATKKQAKSIVEEEAKRLRMPYVTERWLGGMLTNFATIRKSLKKLSSIEKLMKDESYLNLAKRERLMVTREKEKLNKVLGGISELTRLPAAVFIVDVRKEHIAVKEAQKLNVPIFAMVDTNSNPNVADFPIPANDDAYKSIDTIVRYLTRSVEEGLLIRKKDKEDQKLKQEEDEKRQMDEGAKPVEVDADKSAKKIEHKKEDQSKEKAEVKQAAAKKEITPEETAKPVVAAKKEVTPEETAKPVVDDKKETTPEETAKPVVDDKKETTPEETAKPVVDDKKETTPEESAKPVDDDKKETTPEETAKPVVDDKKEVKAEAKTEGKVEDTVEVESTEKK